MIRKKDKFFMQIALNEAQKAYKKKEIPIGAIIVKDNIVIAKAHNLKEKRKDATAHAELIAIQKACKKLGAWRLTGCDLYVTLEPCPMCAGAIIQSRMQRVIIGTTDPKTGALGTAINLFNIINFNHNVNVTTGVLEKQCSNALTAFFKELRNNK